MAKKVKEKYLLTEEEYQKIFELNIKSRGDFKYAIEHLFRVDTGKGYVPFILTPRQREIVDLLMNRKPLIALKPRQAGVSTVTSAVMACVCGFASEDSPEKILLMANKFQLAKKMLLSIKEYLLQLPRWVWGDAYVNDPELSIFQTSNNGEILLVNGSSIKAVGQSKDAGRGYSPTFFIADECAFWENGVDAFIPAMSSLAATDGTAVLISTPNGQDPIYHDSYVKAKEGKNEFTVVEMRWYEDPRFNKDLKWIKGGEEIPEKDFTFKSYEKKIKSGYKPISSWYISMCLKFNGSKRMIAQELDVEFLGSGANFFDAEYIKEHEDDFVEEPIKKIGPGKSIWIWKEPEEGMNYILASDVCGGEDGSGDYATITIIESITLELVLEAKFIVKPDILADYIIDYGLQYNSAYAVVDANGIGTTTVLKLIEKNYPNIHYDENDYELLKGKDEFKKMTRGNKVAGFRTTQARTQLLNNMEEMVRNKQYRIKSSRFIDETRTFVYINGRPDHSRGAHDDLIMTLGMALFIAKYHFRNASKKNEISQALVNYYTNFSKGYKSRAEEEEETIEKEKHQKLVNSSNLWIIANKNVAKSTTNRYNTPIYSNFF